MSSLSLSHSRSLSLSILLALLSEKHVSAIQFPFTNTVVRCDCHSAIQNQQPYTKCPIRPQKIKSSRKRRRRRKRRSSGYFHEQDCGNEIFRTGCAAETANERKQRCETMSCRRKWLKLEAREVQVQYGKWSKVAVMKRVSERLGEACLPAERCARNDLKTGRRQSSRWVVSRPAAAATMGKAKLRRRQQRSGVT